MNGIVQYDLKPHSVELRELPIPEIGEEEVLLQVGAVSVCGSDVHQYHGTQSWPVRTPVVLGHEFGGVVARTGGRVRGFKEGDRVVSETAASICGQCLYCRAGEYNICPQRKGFGYGINGAMADFVRVPERCLHHIPDSLPFERAALTEPCCVAYNCVAVKSKIKPGDIVVVLGPGPIGMLCAEMARINGAGTLIIAGIDQDASRLAAAENLGITYAINLQETNLVDFVHGIGDGLGAHLVIDAAGARYRAARRTDNEGGMGAATVQLLARSAGAKSRYAAGKLQPYFSELGAGCGDACCGADQSEAGHQSRGRAGGLAGVL
jgi:L-iditol 2-dehydrogenase